MPKTLTIQIDDLTEKKLSEVVAAESKSEMVIMQEALSSYLSSRDRFVKMVQKGLKDIKEGRVIKHEDLKQDLEDRLARLG